MTISVSAPCPLTIRPPFSRRTFTSPCASVPLVILLTEYSCSSVSLFTSCSIALKTASTGPLPAISMCCSILSIANVTAAMGCSPVSLVTFRETSCTRSLSVTIESLTKACMSSSKTSCFLSAKALKR